MKWLQNFINSELFNQCRQYILNHTFCMHKSTLSFAQNLFIHIIYAKCMQTPLDRIWTLRLYTMVLIWNKMLQCNWISSFLHFSSMNFFSSSFLMNEFLMNECFVGHKSLWPIVAMTKMNLQRDKSRRIFAVNKATHRALHFTLFNYSFDLFGMKNMIFYSMFLKGKWWTRRFWRFNVSIVFWFHCWIHINYKRIVTAIA